MHSGIQFIYSILFTCLASQLFLVFFFYSLRQGNKAIISKYVCWLSFFYYVVWRAKYISTAVSYKLQAWAGTVPAAEVGKMQYPFFLRCLHSERSSHRFLLFPRITMSCTLLQQLLLHLILPQYIINSLEVRGVGVSPSEYPDYLAPALCIFGLLSVVLFAFSIISN
jgi:hypothetical protein